jgi:chromosome segregation ATPase
MMKIWLPKESKAELETSKDKYETLKDQVKTVAGELKECRSKCRILQSDVDILKYNNEQLQDQIVRRRPSLIDQNKPSMTPNQSKEIMTKWKEDKENIKEANAYSKRLDTDIQKAILKRKTREQEIRDGNSKNGCRKHGANRNPSSARRQKESHT